ncbi:phosphoglycolate phosphatase [Sphingomonas kyeonggiensis]|uniref:phosphoglycolate phosphatase n=1 Tax=Sphingomonas kyeonggiensis TaxID=1268553 RepID=A0A7W7K2E4_9SPHN|nr:HAD hydrolase-like protein [Sphingomonas kyeonggiensis]MBB4839723.1 phosphoglycolate phosphatase [Sphingomonas kyeonggiensis]
MIRHVIFDLDGTLVDSCATCVEILSGMLAERGDAAAIDPVAARSYMSRGGLDMVRGLLGDACVDGEADLADFRARYHAHQTSVETLFPGVAEGLARLRAAGLTLSICSNKPQGLCEKVLADTGLAEHFAFVVGGQPGMRPKPAPDLLDALLARIGGDATACAFVGDSELDHRIAADAAIPFHFLTHGYAEPGWEAQDCATHDTFAPLIDALLARAAAHA